MPSCWRTCSACTEAEALPISASTMAPRPVVVASTIEFTKFDCSVSERVSEALAPSEVATACWKVDRLLRPAAASDAVATMLAVAATDQARARDLLHLSNEHLVRQPTHTKAGVHDRERWFLPERSPSRTLRAPYSSKDLISNGYSNGTALVTSRA